MLEKKHTTLIEFKNRVNSSCVRSQPKPNSYLNSHNSRLRFISQNHKKIHSKTKLRTTSLGLNNMQIVKQEDHQIIHKSRIQQVFYQKKKNVIHKDNVNLNNCPQQKIIDLGCQSRVLIPQINLSSTYSKNLKLTLDKRPVLNQKYADQSNKQNLLIKNNELKQNNHLNMIITPHKKVQYLNKKQLEQKINSKIRDQNNLLLGDQNSLLSADQNSVLLADPNIKFSIQTYDYIIKKYVKNNQIITQKTQKFIKLICYYFYQLINATDLISTKQNLIKFIQKQLKMNQQQNRKANKSTKNIEKQHTKFEDDNKSFQNISQQSQEQSNNSQKITYSKSIISMLTSNKQSNSKISQSSNQSGNTSKGERKKNKSKTQIPVFMKQERKNSLFFNEKSQKSYDSQSKKNVQFVKQSRKSITKMKNFSSKSIQNKQNSSFGKELLVIKPNNIRKKSCFGMQFNKIHNDSSLSKGHTKQSIQNTAGKLFAKQVIKKQKNTNFDSRSRIESRQYIQKQSKVKYRESQIIQFTFEKINQNKKNYKPQKPQKKLALNLSTPYDYTNEDGLMQKRKKYLQLHQKIVQMTQQIDELTNEEAKLTQKIQEKDQELIQLEQKAQKMLQGLETFDEKLKESNNFLSGPECPQMIQKMIYKKQQILQNMIMMKALNSETSNNFIKTKQIQNIMKSINNRSQQFQKLISTITSCQTIKQAQTSIIQIRTIFYSSLQDYSQVIYQFQDKIKEVQQSNSNMMRSLQDWDIQNRIREKISLNSFQDYFTVQKKVSDFVEAMPTFVGKLYENVKEINKIAYNKSDSLSVNALQSKITSIQQVAVQMNKIIAKTKKQSQLVSKQLYKQKIFAIILQKIV